MVLELPAGDQECISFWVYSGSISTVVSGWTLLFLVIRFRLSLLMGCHIFSLLLKTIAAFYSGSIMKSGLIATCFFTVIVVFFFS